MPVVSLDFETYSECLIQKSGAWAYACHPTTDVICMAYAYDDEDPVLWLPGQPLPDFVEHPEHYQLRAWNAFFEMAIWQNVLQWSKTSIQQWTDTAALAAALALPRALGNCGAALGLQQDLQKDKRGKYLIQRLCKPNRGKRIQDPELLQELYDYGLQDVISEREIAHRLLDLNPTERQVWELDLRVNTRGVYVDQTAVENALAIIDQATDALNAEVVEITDSALINVSQRQRVMDYISAQGYKLEKFDKAYIETVLQDDALPPVCRRLLEIRQQTGKTSTAKYRALQQVTTNDSRAHGLLMYHGAATGRWSGKHFQPQNLPRPSFNDTDTCIELFEFRDSALLDLIYDDAMEALSSCVRGMICAPEGKQLIVADYSQIEARVLPWLSGQKDVLDVFIQGVDVYKHTAKRVYKKSLDQITKDERFIGKVATLALGYQGGAKAFQSMAEIYGVDIEESLAEKIKTDWRKANRYIVKYWYDVEAAAVAAVANPGSLHKIRSIQFKVIKGFLFAKLPSGRLLAYYQPRLEPGRFGNEQVTFMGTNSVTRKWERQNTYGGKLVENITQAVARDLMAEAMLRIEAAGYAIVLSVHDELIAEADEGFGSVEAFEELMCELPSWAKGLPVKAEGYTAKRYRK